MGAYLSTPQRRKDSEDGSNHRLKYGASKMQGWKRIQEVKCSCSLEFDEKRNLSLFTLFEGLGGPEVAEYSVQQFTQYLRLFLKEKPCLEGRLEELLAEGFVSFDESLRDDVICDMLMAIREQCQSSAQSKPGNNSKVLSNTSHKDSECTDDEDDDDEDANLLLEEACMPMEELMERYEGGDDTATPLDGVTLHSSSANNSNNTDSASSENSSHPTATSSVTDTTMSQSASNSNNSVTNGVKELSSSENLCVDLVQSIDVSNGIAKLISGDTTVTISNENVKQDEVKAVCEDISQGSDGSVLAGEPSSAADVCQTSVANIPEIHVGTDSADSGSSSCGQSEISVQDRAIRTETASGSSSSTACAANTQNGSSTADNFKHNLESSAMQCDVDSASALCTSRRGNEKRNRSEPSVDQSQTDVDAGTSSSSGYKRLHNRIMDSDDESDDDDESVDPWCSDDISDEDDDSDDISSDDAEEDGSRNGGNGTREDCGPKVRSGYNTGCSALAVLIDSGSADCSRRDLYVAGAGVSRCIVCRAGKAVDVAGGRYLRGSEEGEGEESSEQPQTQHVLPAKALGYHSFKSDDGLMTSLPDIVAVPLSDDDEFVVIASVGIWKILGSQDIVSFIKNHLDAGVDNYSSVCEQLLDMCLAPNLKSPVGCDNMACIIISLTSPKSSDESSTGSRISTPFHQVSLAKKRSASDTTDNQPELCTDNDAALIETKRLRLDGSS